MYDYDNHHSKLLTISWMIILVCVGIVPILTCYAAHRPKEIRESIRFKKRFGSLYKDYK